MYCVYKRILHEEKPNKAYGAAQWWRNTSVNTVLIHVNQRTGYMCTKEANTAEVTQHHVENTSNGLADDTDTWRNANLAAGTGIWKGLEIQKTVQKRAKWHCQERSIIACSNRKDVLQKLLYIFFVTLPAVMGKASCRNFAIFCWNLPAVTGRVLWRKLLFMVVTLPAVMGKVSWRYLWKCDNNLFLEHYFLLHLKHFMTLYCFKQLFLLKCKIFYATALCFCGIVSFLLR